MTTENNKAFEGHYTSQRISADFVRRVKGLVIVNSPKAGEEVTVSPRGETFTMGRWPESLAEWEGSF